MISLAWRQEPIALLESVARPKYQLEEKAPQYMKRAVNLANDYNNGVEHDSTYEDEHIRGAMRVSWWIQCLLIFFVLAFTTISTAEDLAIPFLALPATIVINLVVRAVFKESLTDFIASRLLGAPVQPLIHIERGLRRKLVSPIKID